MTSNGVYLFSKGYKDVRLYHLTNGVISADVVNVGCSIVRLLVPDKNGVKKDVLLAFKNIEEYCAPRCHFAVLIGRYANRIAKAHFELNGKGYDLVNNNMGYPGSLHGGQFGWHTMIWDVVEEETNERKITLTLDSPDMENGFPGNVKAKVVYTLTDDNAICLEYSATSDKDTYVNMTNHAFFNLAGHESGSVLDHIVQINADHYLPMDEESIPTGELRPVKGTPFDFTTPKPLGQDINADDEQIKLGNGYDHNFCLNGEGLKFAAQVEDPKTGRVMKCYTTCPGVQFFSANGLGHAFQKHFGKDDVKYENRNGFCLETQFWPDSPNKPQFPSNLLKAGDEYYAKTVFAFSCK